MKIEVKVFSPHLSVLKCVLGTSEKRMMQQSKKLPIYTCYWQLVES